MSKQHTINSFSHKHPLKEVTIVGSYTCDGCKLYGDSKAYRCNDCNYDLHEYCATCPKSLINSCHGPGHELRLMNGPTHMTVCYVCRVNIQGMFYKCKHCSFESHPLCTNVPMHASSPDATSTKQRSLHQHAYVIQPSSPHHYGQGNPNPYGGHQHQHHQHPYMNPGSPNGDLNPGPSTPETKKKKQRIKEALRVAAGVTAAVATNLVIAAVTGC